MSARSEQLLEEYKELQAKIVEARAANRSTVELEKQMEQLKKDVLNAASNSLNEGKLLKG